MSLLRPGSSALEGIVKGSNRLPPSPGRPPLNLQFWKGAGCHGVSKAATCCTIVGSQPKKLPVRHLRMAQGSMVCSFSRCHIHLVKLAGRKHLSGDFPLNHKKRKITTMQGLHSKARSLPAVGLAGFVFDSLPSLRLLGIESGRGKQHVSCQKPRRASLTKLWELQRGYATFVSRFESLV